MTGAPRFIAGDWGASHLRLSLCDEGGRVVDAKLGPGVAALNRALAPAFQDLVEGWDARYGRLPAVLCGMVGSTLGWRETRYLPCPISPVALGECMLHFEADGRAIAIVPGLSCRNPLSAPDVMRGEETQILGALAREPSLAMGRQLFCLPGTHTKWVMLEHGAVKNFQTSLTGELFQVLRAHSVLVGKGFRSHEAPSGAFARALEQCARDADLVHLLFETRSRQLAAELSADDAADYLSGLIIGRDVSGALNLLGRAIAPTARVTIIAAAELSARYQLALETRGVTVKLLSGDETSLAGLVALYGAQVTRESDHAS